MVTQPTLVCTPSQLKIDAAHRVAGSGAGNGQFKVWVRGKVVDVVMVGAMLLLAN